MNFTELISRRESCRAYNGAPVSREQLTEMVKAAQIAPSACNSQPWKFIVCDGETAQKVAKTVQSPPLPINKWADQAGAFIVICETPARLMKGLPVASQHYAQIDVGIATAYLTLAATELGLSTCIMGWFRENELRELLNVPKNCTVRLVLAVGHAASPELRTKKRKELDEIAGFNQW